MDTSEYMPMFLAEANEHLQELNLMVVRLEEAPQDRETIDEIFRIAHSLKGMSATMGFSHIAELTHEMEDVFELLRQRTEGLPADAVNTVLACLDALSGSFESIETDGEEDLDPAPLIERLHGLVRARTPEQEIDRVGGANPPDLAAALAAGARVLHLVATLEDEVLMPAVRAHMILAALSDYGDLIGSVPSVEGVEQFAGRRIEAWLASEYEEEFVANTVSSISDVLAVQLAEATADDVDGDGDVSDVAAETVAGVVIETVAEVVIETVAGVVIETGPADEAVSLSERQEAAAEPAAPPPAPASASTPTPTPTPTKAGKPKPAASSTRTVRVDAERLDALMHAMGELVIHRTAVEALTAELEVHGLHQAMQELTRSSQALQSMVMQVRMIPVDIVFMRFPRLVRDLSTKLGKELKLELIGSDTELDRTVVDALGDPLVHLVRNSLDHGLEPADEREAAGKPRVGTLEITARHAGGSVVIEVRDDGRGIDAQAVARKALASGLIDAQAAEEIDVKAAVELLFAAGFSTAETTSDISGRGVGMDAVRTSIRELGGEVTLDSVPGQGTLAQIRLPLTLAIVSALHVDVAGAPYAIPLDRVERTLRLADQAVSSLAGRRMLMLDDGVLPLLAGAEVFGRPAQEEPQFAVIIRGGDQRMALAVNDLIGQRELVTRPLPPIVSIGEPVSGGAALADGRIALIIDCDAVAADQSGLTAGRDTSPNSSALASGRIAA